MKPEITSTSYELGVNNELDIRSLFCALWCGRRWIVGITFLFALVALGISYLMRPQWIAIAITDKPTVSQLGSYYSQQQFLQHLDASVTTSADAQSSIVIGAYEEFVTQLTAYDTRRDFWLMTDYYKQRQKDDAKANAVLLDEFINNIQFTLHDDKKVFSDSVKLTAETPADANKLLRQYVEFACQRSVNNLIEGIQGVWRVRTLSMKERVKLQTSVEQDVYNRAVHTVQQALKIAIQQSISRSQAGALVGQLQNSEMFLLGEQMLQARLEMLQATGPNFNIAYDQNRAMLATLNAGPKLNNQFQTYRYLRTPEDPVMRDSPRRTFLCVMWGVIGVLVGAGVVLARRPRD